MLPLGYLRDPGDEGGEGRSREFAVVPALFGEARFACDDPEGYLSLWAGLR